MRKENQTHVSVVGVAVLCLFGGCTCHMSDDGAQEARDIEEARVRLLCETDHQALLEGCRKIAKDLEPGGYTWSALSPEEIAKFPEVIRVLQPKSVSFVKDGPVIIEMSTKWYPLGVCAFPEGFSARNPYYPSYGDRKLCEGLWYYDDGYRPDPVVYDRVIDTILRDCGRLDK